MQTAGGVQKHHIIAPLPGVEHRLFRGNHRVLVALFKHRNTQFFTADLQLLNCRGAVYIASHQQRISALPLHEAGQLAAVGGFTGAL